MARLLAPNRGVYPRQYAGNPIRARRVVLAGVNGMGMMGRLGDDTVPSFSAAADSASMVLPDLAAAAAPTDFAALTVAQDNAYLPSTDPAAASYNGPNAAADAQAAAVYDAATASYNGPNAAADADAAAKYNAAMASSAKPSTPTPPSNSSVDWTKLITAASAGLISSGGTIAANAIKAKSAAQQANAARQAQMSAAAKAAAMAKAGLKTATSSTGLIVIGGVAVVGLIIFLASRK